MTGTAKLPDPVVLEILNQRFAATVQEMASSIHRTSRSTFVKEGMDFNVGLTNAEGEIFAFPRGANTFSIDRHCAPVMAAVSDLEPGDVIGTSDPYTSGGLVTHSPDLNLLKPYFHEGRIVAFGWCFAHLTDVGGAVPGSLSAHLNSIFQEGIRFPPMKVVRRGKVNPVFEAFFNANSRIPAINAGDFRGLLSGLAIGEQRVAQICARYGAETFVATQARLMEYAAEKARDVLRRIPNGVHEFWDYLDDDLITPHPVRVRVRLTVEEGEVEIDVTGTDPQTPTAYNCPTLNRRHAWFVLKLTIFMLTHDRSIPLNAGIYRSIRAVNPPGTIMNAAFPDAVGFRTPVAIRCNDAVTGALLSASDDLLPAPSAGCTSTLVLSEYEHGATQPTVKVLQPLRGGMGAYRGRDGVDGRDVTMNNMRNHPIEVIEKECGVFVHDYDVRPDSGGFGRWRGGCGQRIRIEPTRAGSRIMLRGAERFRFTAWGVAGGGPGAPYRLIVDEGRPTERVSTKADSFYLAPGQTLTVSMPGAAGFGDPAERDLADVARDLRFGFVTHAAAARDYLVAFDADGEIDPAASAALRNRPGRPRRTGFDFGPERRAWETVLDDALMMRIASTLNRYPKTARNRLRRRIFDTAIPGFVTDRNRSLVDLLADPAATRARLLCILETIEGAAPSRKE